MSGIRTKGINGIVFRSINEARYSDFFTVMKWKWEYEPIELNGYIPDFIVEDKLLAEVKHDTVIADLQRYSTKIIHSGWKKDFMIVGSYPSFINETNIHNNKLKKIAIGLFFQPLIGKKEAELLYRMNKVFLCFCKGCDRMTLSFMNLCSTNKCLFCNSIDISTDGGYEHGDIIHCWSEIKNKYQYNNTSNINRVFTPNQYKISLKRNILPSFVTTLSDLERTVEYYRTMIYQSDFIISGIIDSLVQDNVTDLRLVAIYRLKKRNNSTDNHKASFDECMKQLLSLKEKDVCRI